MTKKRWFRQAQPPLYESRFSLGSGFFYAEKLGFTDKIKFYVIAVKITNNDEVKEKYDGIRSDIFLIMKNQTIYEFDWENIAIEKIN